MRKFLIALAALGGILVTSSDALATPLPAGASSIPPDGLPEASTTLFASKGPILFDVIGAAGEIKGSFIERVYVEGAGSLFGAGRLNFDYQVTIEIGDIGRLAVDGFAGFFVDVSTFQTNTTNPLVATDGFAVGTKAPGTADRSAFLTDGGDLVGFNFSPTLTAPPTYSTYVMIIRTNATATSINDISIKDGVSVDDVSIGPKGGLGAPTPEPSTLLLLGGLTAGIGGARLRRWWKGRSVAGC